VPKLFVVCQRHFLKLELGHFLLVAPLYVCVKDMSEIKLKRIQKQNKKTIYTKIFI